MVIVQDPCWVDGGVGDGLIENVVELGAWCACERYEICKEGRLWTSCGQAEKWIEFCWKKVVRGEEGTARTELGLDTR